MKEAVLIDGLSYLRVAPPHGSGLTSISEKLLQELCAAFPSGRCGSRGHSFSLNLMSDDSRLKEVIRILNEHGYTPRSSAPSRTEREFNLVLVRQYDRTDLESAELLELRPSNEMLVDGCARRQSDMTLCLESPLHIDLTASIAQPSCYIMRDHVKHAFEAAGLRDVCTLPVTKLYESVDYNLDDKEDTYWELRSSTMLPPVAPSVSLVHRDRTVFTGDFRKGCLRVEGFYLYPELHYSRASLTHMKPFDLAHTSEMFGWRPNQFDRPLVASQRFYQVCLEHNIKTGWVPVRIDED